MLVGGCLGFLVNSLNIPIGTEFCVTGIPIPGVIFHLEDWKWVDFVVPLPYVNWVINLGLFGLAGTTTVALVLGRRKVRPNQSAHDTAPKLADPGH